MRPRLDPAAAAPDALRAMLALEAHVRASGLPAGLIHLVKARASQINGCAYCVHMHTREARADGETEERLHLLAVWRESPLFTPRERAALAWTEVLTRVADGGAPAIDYDEARRHFDERELVELTLLIGAINVWNRIAVGFRLVHPLGAEALAGGAA